MHVVVLAKAVPKAEASGIRPDAPVRASGGDLVLNPGDEHALEAALRLKDSDAAVRTTMLSMAPEGAWPGLSKAVAAGVDRAVLISDLRLEGSCILSTARVLAAALRGEQIDLLLAGESSSDAGGGVVTAAVATLLGLPFVPGATEVRLHGREVRARVAVDDGFELLAVPLPAFVTVSPSVGPFRYPTLRSIIATRSFRPTLLRLDDLDRLPLDVARPTTRVLSRSMPDRRGEAQVITGDVRALAGAVADFLASRRVLQ